MQPPPDSLAQALAAVDEAVTQDLKTVERATVLLSKAHAIGQAIDGRIRQLLEASGADQAAAPPSVKS
jgi:hypothetical protein